MPASSNPRRSSGRPTGGTAVTREQIVDAALAQLDEGGLGSVSMREIAARLGVYPASVQWHVRSRDELLAAVAQRVLADVAPALGRRTWQVWITELMRRCRRQVRKHPNAAQLLTTQLVSNASLPFKLVEGVLTTLASAGLRDNRLIEGYNTVIASMLGFVTMEFAALPPDHDSWGQRLKDRVHSVRPQDHPMLAQLLPQLANRAFILRWDNGVAAPLDASFERHVAIVVAGLQAFVNETAAPTEPPG